jgi:beta-aspartyl-peptidase (threonine type)
MSLIVHGGAWDIPDSGAAAHKEGIANAVRSGWKVLSGGGSAVAAVEAAVAALEDDETFDAGRGSFMNASGEVELDASIMDGKTLKAGAVAAVSNVKNPVSLARKVMEDGNHVFLVGMGAVRFARENGIELCRKDDLIIPRELERWRELQRTRQRSIRSLFTGKNVPSDTVGAVALDRYGNLASATSTGGLPNKFPGRVGDSPLIGCGTYADNQVGAVSTTGWGEAMIRVVMAKTIIDLMERDRLSPAEAGKEGLKILRKKVNGYGGFIILNRKGEPGVVYNTSRMARGYMTSGLKSPAVAV